MKKSPIALCIAAALLAAAPAYAETPEEALARRLDALSQELDALKAQVKQLKAQNEALAAQQEATTSGVTTATADSSPYVAPTGVSPQVSANTVLGRTLLFGYGEINYSHYDHDSARTEATVRRAVFGIGYRFNENTRFVSEFEIENAVVSAEDGGELEVEQFYVDHRLNNWANLKVGLLLIPSGYINVTHEPPGYFGVERNFVETAIIPSTEREGGIGLYGSTKYGLSYDIGVTTSFNFANWDFASNEGRESPLGAAHQELSNARAADLAQYAALNYDGIRGLNVGASVFTGEAGQNQPNFDASPHFTLTEAHARYVRGPLQLQALYAQGHISDTAQINLANVGQPTPIPSNFHGWYLQGAYRVWKQGDYALTPFFRYERFNTADNYAELPAGLGVPGLGTETVRTYGASFFLNPNVVLKADYQQFGIDKASNRFNLGIGLQF